MQKFLTSSEGHLKKCQKRMENCSNFMLLSHRDTERWRTTEFNGICSKIFDQCSTTNHFYKDVDKPLILKQQDRPTESSVYLIFFSDTVANINMTISSGAVRTDAVDTLKELMNDNNIVCPTWSSRGPGLASGSHLPQILNASLVKKDYFSKLPHKDIRIFIQLHLSMFLKAGFKFFVIFWDEICTFIIVNLTLDDAN